MVACASVTEAAKQAGCSRALLYQWVRRDDFAAALAEAQRQAYTAALASIAELAARAVAALGELLDDPLPTIRLAASKAVLDAASSHVLAAELERRVARLETQAGER